MGWGVGSLIRSERFAGRTFLRAEGRAPRPANPDGIAASSPRLAEQRDAYLGSHVGIMANPEGIPGRRGGGAQPVRG